MRVGCERTASKSTNGHSLRTHKLAKTSLVLRQGANRREQFRHRNLQRPCDSADVDERWIPFTALDSADVRVVQARPVRQLLLREATRLSQLAHPSPERQLQLAHARIVGVLDSTCQRL